MLGPFLKSETKEKNISCPVCGLQTLSHLMLIGGNEASCDNCNSKIVSKHQFKQRLVGLIIIASCAPPFLNIWLLPIPFFAFYFGNKFDLKLSNTVVEKVNS